MASVRVLTYLVLVLLFITRGSEVSAAVLLNSPISAPAPIPAKTPQALIHWNLSTLIETPEWMTEPLFHSPRAFAVDYAEMKSHLRIYIYPRYPDKYEQQFGGGEPKDSPLPYGNYASDAFIFRNLYESELRTDDPEKAHFFALPFSVFNTRMTIGAGAVSGFVREYMEETVIKKWSYWNRSGGADHFYSTCHDIGVGAADNTPFLSGSAIQIICPADRWKRNYIPTKDFSFPQIWPRYDSEPGGLTAAERKASKMHAYWSGSNNSRLRNALWETWADDDEILMGGGRLLKKAKGEGYYSNFRKSKYCLHVTGRQVHTARIGDAIFFGCVPVILSDQFDLPFGDLLDWREFAVIVEQSQLPQLKTILKSIPDERYNKLHRNVEIVRRLFTWNSPPQDYDIFHMIMYDLWLRRFLVRPPLDKDMQLS